MRRRIVNDFVSCSCVAAAEYKKRAAACVSFTEVAADFFMRACLLVAGQTRDQVGVVKLMFKLDVVQGSYQRGTEDGDQCQCRQSKI